MDLGRKTRVYMYRQNCMRALPYSMSQFMHLGQVAQIQARLQPESAEAVRQPESALVTHAEALEAEGAWSKAIDAYLSVTQQHTHDQDRQVEVCQYSRMGSHHSALTV